MINIQFKNQKKKIGLDLQTFYNLFTENDFSNKHLVLLIGSLYNIDRIILEPTIHDYQIAVIFKNGENVIFYSKYIADKICNKYL